ncbi:hypothetical protein DSM106972_080190 [Dulcicalothrix desertica PCC 7102]|uniref:Uncharacterized protein n=1 Tax=Dulcicalothrix desertica PCC 7102 TaxID=232991 RepID=A0A433UXS2_9CYAN|nr:alr0857 family protein [Dulcicalothrix desertica]RUS98633.1 hypothetical protein DSM106972_080190 [Dulcicalothrix desertica PCC 7102]TWH43138.1 hypothetical protein CAL7102_06838 [Dulcicalothrix desertica PCC 7102]
MLKLTYAENSFDLEYIDQLWENWINTRVVLALQSGCNIHVKNITASFTIKLDSFEFDELSKAVKNDNKIEICYCDVDVVEISLKGVWLSSNVDSEEGVFVTALNTLTEFYLVAVEQKQHSCYSAL